jgi:hypothetical protein
MLSTGISSESHYKIVEEMLADAEAMLVDHIPKKMP